MAESVKLPPKVREEGPADKCRRDGLGRRKDGFLGDWGHMLHCGPGLGPRVEPLDRAW